jgi:hypothetical protein
MVRGEASAGSTVSARLLLPSQRHHVRDIAAAALLMSSRGWGQVMQWVVVAVSIVCLGSGSGPLF